MKTFRFLRSSVLLLAIFAPITSQACDVCGCYTPNQELNSEPLHPRQGGFYFAAAEQYTFFGTTKFSGREVPNTADQYEQSSITQVIGGYNFNDRFGVQINAPLIDREYKRPEGFTNQRGTVSGLGDMSLLLNFVALHKETNFGSAATHAPTDAKDAGKDQRPPGSSQPLGSPQKDFTFSLNLIAGVKFPTGSAGRIKEEFNEVEIAGATPSGIHGHDLALGSGSYDAIMGAGAFVRYKAGFFQANVQYTVRTTGAYDYRYANDVSFDVGPGYFFLQGRDFGRLGPVTFGAHSSSAANIKTATPFAAKSPGTPARRRCMSARVCWRASAAGSSRSLAQTCPCSSTTRPSRWCRATGSARGFR